MARATLRCLTLPILAGAALLTACGTAPTISKTAERGSLNNPAHVTEANIQTFMDHLRQISTSSGRSGDIPVHEFLNIMPMEDGERDLVLDAFPSPYSVTCDAHGLCQASTTGNSDVEAVIDITLNGVSQPKLALESQITTGLTLRANGIEFCNAEGMWAKKFFITRKVQGILVTKNAGNVRMTVNVDDDDQNFTCQ